MFEIIKPSSKVQNLLDKGRFYLKTFFFKYVTCNVRNTLHCDTLWQIENLTLQKTGTQKTDQSKHKPKIKVKWLILIANVVEVNIPAFQV